jgi:hypothetical protein
MKPVGVQVGGLVVVTLKMAPLLKLTQATALRSTAIELTPLESHATGPTRLNADADGKRVGSNV